jgi:AbrB family looped-hinge helix DNA binding protein
MTYRVGAKGQVVIPKPLRVALNLEPGDEVLFWQDGDHVSLRPARLDRPLRGRFADSDVDLVAELEAEHLRDRERESTRR